MPRYTVQAPSGKTYEIEGPDGATPEQLGQFILSQNRDERVAMQQQKDRELYDPTKGMSTTDKVLAGIGKGITDLARGAGQWVGAVSRDDVAEARRLDAPLMNTKAGRVGEFVGKAVPVAASSVLIPGAATVGGATAIGAGAGALEPSTSTRETLGNITLGGAAGAVGQKAGNWVANKLGERAANKAAQFSAQQTANAQRLQAARTASGQGYVIPPSDVQPQGALMEALGGLSGKIKTAQVASQRNQGVTDSLARKAVGLNPDDALTRDVLKSIRSQAGAAYDQLRNAGTVVADKTYNDALDALLKQSNGAAKSFPGLKADKLDEVVATMRQPSFDAGDAIDATKVLRDLSETAYGQGDKALAKAYRGVSDALEDALDRHVAQTGSPDAVKAFRDARKLIAKTYTVEKALNGETGAVSAQALAQQLRRGKPLSGELKTIAEIAEAFPKATQALKEAPKALSPLDFGAAGIGLAGSGGNPLAALGLAARPAARSALLSAPMQRNALRDLAAPTSRLANVADNPLSRLLYGPVGAVGGLALMNAE